MNKGKCRITHGLRFPILCTIFVLRTLWEWKRNEGMISWSIFYGVFVCNGKWLIMWVLGVTDVNCAINRCEYWCKSGRFARQFLSFCIATTVCLGCKSCRFVMLWLSDLTIKRLLLRKNDGFLLLLRLGNDGFLGWLFSKTNFFVELFLCRKRRYLQLGILNFEFWILNCWLC